MIYKNFAHVYDTAMRRFEYTKWVDYIEKAFNRFKINPKTILELGCGTGNLTVELYNRGYDLVGVDVSQDMLDIARKKADSYGKIEFLNQDICKLRMDKKFDCVVGFMDVMNYITQPNSLINVFKNIYNQLSSDGVFIFDIRSPYIFLNLMNDSTFAENTDTISYICENRYNSKTRMAQMTVTFFYEVDSHAQMFKKNVETHKLRCYTVDEIKSMISEANLNILGVYDEFTFKRPSDKSERYFFIVSK